MVIESWAKNLILSYEYKSFYLLPRLLAVINYLFLLLSTPKNVEKYFLGWDFFSIFYLMAKFAFELVKGDCNGKKEYV